MVRSLNSARYSDIRYLFWFNDRERLLSLHYLYMNENKRGTVKRKQARLMASNKSIVDFRS